MTAMLAACAGDPSPAVTPDAGPAATWESVQTIFTASCNFSTCHGGVAGSFTLTGSATDVRAALLAPSFEVARLARVTPGDPASSYLLVKLEGRMADVPECRATPMVCGVSMPQGEPLLTAEQRATVRAWIAAGAPGPR